jgi:hypothetical protein
MLYKRSSLYNIDTELIPASSIRLQPPTTIDIRTIQTNSQTQRHEVCSRFGHLDGDQCTSVHSRKGVHVEFGYLPRRYGRRSLGQQRFLLPDEPVQERRERCDALDLGVQWRQVLQSRALEQRWRRHGGAQSLR